MAKQVTQTEGQAGWTLDVFSGSRSWHGVRESSLPGGIAPSAGPWAGAGALVSQPWLQQGSHPDLPLLTLACNFKSFNCPPPQGGSLSPLHHTGKYFAFSSAEYKAEVST